jgi:hypothetical protein
MLYLKRFKRKKFKGMSEQSVLAWIAVWTESIHEVDILVIVA